MDCEGVDVPDQNPDSWGVESCARRVAFSTNWDWHRVGVKSRSSDCTHDVILAVAVGHSPLVSLKSPWHHLKRLTKGGNTNSELFLQTENSKQNMVG